MALIHITYRCDETCSHCLVNAGPQHPEGISRVNFSEVLSRISKMLSPHEPLMIAGGEPTLHPQWVAFVKEACRRFEGPVMLLTNGMWVLDERGSAVAQEWRKLKRRFGERLMGQVRTHPEYYAHYDQLWRRKLDLEALGFQVFNDEIHIIPMGRARYMAAGKMYPSCVNYRLAMRQRAFKGIGDLLRLVRSESRSNLCTPLVDDKGVLYLGESNLCMPIGNLLRETEEALLQRALTALDGCRNCGPALDVNYRNFLRDKQL